MIGPLLRLIYPPKCVLCRRLLTREQMDLCPDCRTNAPYFPKSKIKLSQIILIAVYLGIWAIALIVFWFFTSGSDGMAYSLMFLWLLLPVSTFTVSLLIAKNGFFGKLRWLSSPIFGLFHMLAEYATFNLANMVAFSKFNLPRPEYFLAGAVISLLGLAVGKLVCRKNKS